MGNFRKGCTAFRGNREITENINIAVLSQGLLSRIVGQIIVSNLTNVHKLVA